MEYLGGLSPVSVRGSIFLSKAYPRPVVVAPRRLSATFRVAQVFREATTARKGNRNVSLTISGWVAEQVMWWDDGEEQNVYVGGIGTTLASLYHGDRRC
jgi:hypothetical protein